MPDAATAARRRRADALAALQREQVLAGLAEAIVEKGYAGTTIADIARAARVSKTTVYAHFADKEQAFLALNRAAADRELAAVREAFAASAGLAWEARVEATVSAYLHLIAEQPALLHVAHFEALAVGPAARAARREQFDRFAELLVALSGEIAAAAPTARPLSRSLALGAIGGINELLVRASEEGPDALRALVADAADLLVRLLRA